MAIRLNEDKELVAQIREGLRRRGGYCPCRLEKTEDNKCICKEFREQMKDPNFEGYCHCMLYYKTKTPSRRKHPMLKITATNYDELVARADRPVLLDFWAEWCGPCRMVSPVVEEIAAAHPEIAVGKVNVDEEPALAQAFRVQSIPMLVLLRDNAVVAAAVGAQSKEQLEQKLGL